MPIPHITVRATICRRCGHIDTFSVPALHRAPEAEPALDLLPYCDRCAVEGEMLAGGGVKGGGVEAD